MISQKVIIGKILYMGIGQFLPRSYSVVNLGQRKFRAFCGKLILKKCGRDVNIERRAIFSKKTELGDRSGIGAHSVLTGKVIIGKDVMMGTWCTIYTRNHKTDDVTRPMNTQGFQEERPVFIGDDVWIGGHVTILPGVCIGSHSIIGAGSVVTKDVPAWAVAAGNPAVVKKYRKSIDMQMKK